MEKFPFTDQGAADLIATLYQLSDQDLQLEANTAGSDFSLWISEYFELDQDQLDYLDGVDPQWIGHAAADTKVFLENRKPILLHKMSKPVQKSENGDRGKLLDLDKKQSANYSEQNGYSESEELLFSISYNQ
ncbi:hypothetical protein [Pedobacter helvus]|uniref:Uncharacterized protein n=1 Tax=Pedobacter helvus TaxID=2563444 RepID=A0ABW9JHR5_9SPHI|nr:hypothetical protein [Pedobacter ureilyticus]